MRQIGLVFVALIALLAVSGCLSGGDSSKKSNTVDGDKSSTGNLSADSVRALLSRDEKNDYITVNDGQVNITRKMSDNFNNDMMVKGSKIAAIDIFKSVFADQRVSQVMIVSSIQLTDKYGQTSNELGSVYKMKRDTYQKVNWDKFLFDNLDKVADGSYVNPVLLS